MTTHKRRALWILIVLLLLVGLSAIWWYPRWLRGPDLFVDLPASEQPATFPQQDLAKRFRWVKLTASALTKMEKTGARFHLNLFPDEKHIVFTDYLRPHDNGTMSVSGLVNDDPDTMFILAKAGDVRMGSVTLNDGRQFLITHIKDGKYVVLEGDPSKAGPCGSCNESHAADNPTRRADGSPVLPAPKPTSQTQPDAATPAALAHAHHHQHSIAATKIDVVEKIEFAKGKQRMTRRYGASPMLSSIGLPVRPQLAASYGLWGRGGTRRRTMGPASSGLLNFQRSGNTEYIDIFFYYTSTAANIAGQATNIAAVDLTNIRAQITLMIDIQNDVFLKCGMPHVVRQAGEPALARNRAFGNNPANLTGSGYDPLGPSWSEVKAPRYVNTTDANPNVHIVWATNGVGQTYAGIGIYEPVFENKFAPDSGGYLGWLGSNNNSTVYGDQFWGTGLFENAAGTLRQQPYFNYAEGTIQWRLQPGQASGPAPGTAPTPMYPRSSGGATNLTIGVGPIDHPDANHAIKCEPAYLGIIPPNTLGGFLMSGTYDQILTTITVTAVGHGFTVGSRGIATITSGTGTSGLFTVISVPDANTFTYTVVLSQPMANGGVDLSLPGSRNWPLGNYDLTYMTSVYGESYRKLPNVAPLRPWVSGPLIQEISPDPATGLISDRLRRYDLGADDTRFNIFLPGAAGTAADNGAGLVDLDPLAVNYAVVTNALNLLGYNLGAGNAYGSIFDPQFGNTNSSLALVALPLYPPLYRTPTNAPLGNVPSRMRNPGPGTGALATMPPATHIIGIGGPVAAAVGTRYPNVHRLQERPFNATAPAPSREPRADILCILTEFGGGVANYFNARGGGAPANLLGSTAAIDDTAGTALVAGTNAEGTYRMACGLNTSALSYVFSHELGHVLGGMHGVGDENAGAPPGPPLRYDDTSLLFSPWKNLGDTFLGTGNHFVAWGAQPGQSFQGGFGRYCTIMAYSAAATNAGGRVYTRIPRYSSKDVYWRGVATGEMPNWKNPFANFSQLYADNARGISAVSFVAGKYRDDNGSGRLIAVSPVPTRFPNGAPTTPLVLAGDAAPSTGTGGDNTTPQTKANTSSFGKNTGSGLGGTVSPVLGNVGLPNPGGGLGGTVNPGGGLGGTSKGGLPGTTPRPTVPVANNALPNDNSTNAMLYPVGVNWIDAHNLGATPEDWEQAWNFLDGVAFADDNRKTVWFYYKPYDGNGNVADARITAKQGELVFSTLGSNFDTKLAVLGGFNIREAVSLKANDNQGNGPHSEVRIPYDYNPDQATNKPKNRLKDFYLIGVAGVNGASGRIKLSIRPSP